MTKINHEPETVESLPVTIKGFPRDLHTAAKIAAAGEKQPMKYWIMDACKEKLDRENK